MNKRFMGQGSGVKKGVKQRSVDFNVGDVVVIAIVFILPLILSGCVSIPIPSFIPIPRWFL